MRFSGEGEGAAKGPNKTAQLRKLVSVFPGTPRFYPATLSFACEGYQTIPVISAGFGRQDLIHKGVHSGAEPVMKSVVWTSVIPFALGTCGFIGEKHRWSELTP